jgi:hypothetical protein
MRADDADKHTVGEHLIDFSNDGVVYHSGFLVTIVDCQNVVIEAP